MAKKCYNAKVTIERYYAGEITIDDIPDPPTGESPEKRHQHILELIVSLKKNRLSVPPIEYVLDNTNYTQRSVTLSLKELKRKGMIDADNKATTRGENSILSVYLKN